MKISRTACFAIMALCLAACDRGRKQLPASSTHPPDASFGGGPTRAAVEFRVPRPDEIADSVVRASALRGRAILEATKDSLPANVGNALRCTSCHFAGGTQKNAMPWIGVYARFPQYRARSGRVDLIENRINDCFERSMNGHALALDGREMHDIVSYMAFLSSGIPGGAQVEGQGLPKLASLTGDTASGAQLFAGRCVRCHGKSGEGTELAPPLWGPGSYNIGAGMSRVSVLAAFIHELMPRDSARTLSPQQAYDIARYVSSRPRPDFPGKERDWPHGGAPGDVAYNVKSSGGRSTATR